MLDATTVGLRPPYVAPNTRRPLTNENRRDDTYHLREAVQTIGATSSSPYQTALALAKKVDESPLGLAEALWNLNRKEPGRLNELMGASGLKRRRAYYLAGVWSRFADLKICVLSVFL